MIIDALTKNQVYIFKERHLWNILSDMSKAEDTSNYIDITRKIIKWSNRVKRNYIKYPFKTTNTVFSRGKSSDYLLQSDH